MNLIKTLNIDTPVHLSTQANTTNSESIKFWQERGVRRIILARELHFSEIQKIREKGINEDKILIRVKNPISTGDRVTGISPDEVVSFTILDMHENGQKVKKASGAQGQCVTAKIDARLKGNGWKFGIIARS